MNPRITSSVSVRRLGQVAVDACLIALALLPRLRPALRRGHPRRATRTCWSTRWRSWWLAKLALFAAFGLYSKLWRFVDQADFESIVKAVVVSSFVLIGGLFLLAPGSADPPRGVIALDFLLTLALVAGARFLVRALVERPRGPLVQRADSEVLIVGAGNGGQQVAMELRRNPELKSAVLGFVDDDPRKRGMLVSGYRVHGSTDDLPRVLDDTKPDEVVIAIPSAPGIVRQKVVTACRARDIPVRTLPTTFELLSRGPEPAAPGARGAGGGRARPRAGARGDRPRGGLPERPRGAGDRRRAARSAPSCAARSRASSPSASCWWTTPRTTSSRSAASWRRSATSARSPPCSPTARTPPGCASCSPRSSPRWSSTPRRTSTCR